MNPNQSQPPPSLEEFGQSVQRTVAAFEEFGQAVASAMQALAEFCRDFAARITEMACGELSQIYGVPVTADLAKGIFHIEGQGFLTVEEAMNHIKVRREAPAGFRVLCAPPIPHPEP